MRQPLGRCDRCGERRYEHVEGGLVCHNCGRRFFEHVDDTDGGAESDDVAGQRDRNRSETDDRHQTDPRPGVDQEQMEPGAEEGRQQIDQRARDDRTGRDSGSTDLDGRD